mgnify:CR=1 FL=1
MSFDGDIRLAPSSVRLPSYRHGHVRRDCLRQNQLRVGSGWRSRYSRLRERIAGGLFWPKPISSADVFTEVGAWCDEIDAASLLFSREGKGYRLASASDDEDVHVGN